MSNEKLLAALPLAALFAALMMHLPARAAGQEGMVVVRDPQTGQLRAPTPAEMKALHQSSPTAALHARAPLSSAVVTKPNGSRVLRLGDRGQVFSVVNRAPDGELVQQCVHGEDAARKALAQPATPRHNQELRHEDR